MCILELEHPLCLVRRARKGDLNELVSLCAEHAEYERAYYDPVGKAERLEQTLFVRSPRIHAWVATNSDVLVGYATAAAEFSTWTTRDYLHMDCLFVRDGQRGAGVGAALLQAVLCFAREHGYPEVQWQTPAWNLDAARFYRRNGALDSGKLRFAIDLSRGG